jgi:glycine oxidase
LWVGHFIVKKTTHVVVVGAGVIGCAVAYEVARRGGRVHVIDRGEVGQGATQASAGVLAPYIMAHAESQFLELGGRSLGLYDEFMARVVEDSGSAVQYVRSGTLEVARDSKTARRLQETACAYRDLGVTADYLDQKAVHEAEPQLSETVLSGLVVASHGFVGAADLTNALRRAASAYGVIFTPSALAVKVSRSRGDGLQVDTPNDRVVCDAVVMAAGSWSGQVEAESEEPVPVRPVRGQLLHLGWPKSPLERVIWTDRCYLVPWTDGSVLVGATVEEVGFDERATVSGVQQLIDMTCELVPTARTAWFQGVRVGLRPGTPDDLPAIGPSERLPGLFYATGHFRNGVLLAPLTAQLVADYVLDGTRDAALEVTALNRFKAD